MAPIAAADLWIVAPLGQLNPTSHVFPTDHLYLTLARIDGVPKIVNVSSPGAMTVTEITSQTFSSTGLTQYAIRFSPCAKYQGFFGHLVSLAPALEAATKEGSGKCESYKTGGQTIASCRFAVALVLAAGDPVGTAGGKGDNTYSLDFGTFDARKTAGTFANPARWETSRSGFDEFHVACPLDAFEAAAKGELEGMLGGPNGKRTTLPLCGSIYEDQLGTAQGVWFNPAHRARPEDPHLALVHDNVDPALLSFSVGSSVPNLPAGVYSFSAESSGKRNRAFGDITADGGTYCFDSLSALNGAALIVQLIDATTLKIEKQGFANCGPGPWSFSNGVFSFKR